MRTESARELVEVDKSVADATDVIMGPGGLVLKLLFPPGEDRPPRMRAAAPASAADPLAARTMSDADPAATVHYHLARLGARLTGTSGPIPGAAGQRDYVDSCMTSELPTWRRTYAFSAMTGWCALMAVATVVTIGFGYMADSAGGESARRAVVAVCGAGLMFCSAGIFNTLWRAVWFTWKAQWRARRDGTADERFARAMRGILPRNSSLIGQSIVAVLTLVIVLV